MSSTGHCGIYDVLAGWRFFVVVAEKCNVDPSACERCADGCWELLLNIGIKVITTNSKLAISMLVC